MKFTPAEKKISIFINIIRHAIFENIFRASPLTPCRKSLIRSYGADVAFKF